MIVFAWNQGIEEFYLRVTHCHSEVFVSFCMREINGSPLICGILQRLVELQTRSLAERRRTSLGWDSRRAEADVDLSGFHQMSILINA
jgi:hypothetical protein